MSGSKLVLKRYGNAGGHPGLACCWRGHSCRWLTQNVDDGSVLQDVAITATSQLAFACKSFRIQHKVEAFFRHVDYVPATDIAYPSVVQARRKQKQLAMATLTYLHSLHVGGYEALHFRGATFVTACSANVQPFAQLLMAQSNYGKLTRCQQQIQYRLERMHRCRFRWISLILLLCFRHPAWMRMRCYLPPSCGNTAAELPGARLCSRGSTLRQTRQLAADARCPRLAGRMGASPWQRLGLQRGSSKDEIRARYRELAATEHPDKRTDLDPSVASARFAEITLAYRDLMERPADGESVRSTLQDEVWEEVNTEIEPESYVIFYAILFWVLALVLLSGQDWFTWEGCFQQWQWWCNFMGS